MKIEVRFAGFYRTMAGTASFEVEMADESTVGEALVVINDGLDGRLDRVLGETGEGKEQPFVLILVDTVIVERDEVLKEGDVLALVPPMAGGQ